MATVVITYYKDKDIYDMLIKRKQAELVNDGMDYIDSITHAKALVNRVACTQTLHINKSTASPIRDLVSHITITKGMQYTFELNN